MQLNRRLPSQRGQVTLEYLGVLVAVTAIIAVLLIAAPSIGQEIVCGIKNQIAKLGIGGGCTPQTPSALNAPCVVSDTDSKIKASLTLFSVKGGGEVRILREKLSDGTVRVTVSYGGTLGGNFGLGGKAEVDAGQSQYTAGAQVKANVNGTGGVGRSWTVPGDDEADELVDIIRNNLRDDAIDGAVPLLGSVGTSLLGEDRQPPEPDVTYTQGGIGGEVKAEAGDIAGYAEGGLEAQAVVGERKNNKTGERTVYFQLRGSGTASAGALLGLGAQGDFDGLVGVTYDRDGNRTRLTLIGKAGVAGAVPEGGAIKDPSDLISKLKLVGQEQAGYRLEVQADLDLTNPDNNAAFDEFKSNPLTGASQLADRFAAAGEFTARTYKFDRSKYGGSAEGAVGIKFGIEGSYENVDSEIQGAWYWTPTSGGVKQWVTCNP